MSRFNKVLGSVQTFLHSVTSNDRYASYDSQAGSAALNKPTNSDPSRLGMLPNASTTSLDHPSNTDPSAPASAPFSTHNSANNSSASLSSRSQSQRPAYQQGQRSHIVGNNVPLQDYADGTPPPPSVAVSWSRIERWVEANYPELYDQLNEPVTAADLNELEADLDCSFPLEVRDSWMVHDGQERGGKPAGLLFNLTLLDLESIEEEWSTWKRAAVKLNEMRHAKPKRSGSSSAPSSSSSAPSSSSAASSAQSQVSPTWLDRQDCVPPNTIQKVYAHPAWIPLAKDWEGNNIGVDLAPGPAGRWGQVILFGRDFDRKYVVASSWAAFLSQFADDLESAPHLVNDDIETGELTFRAPNGLLVHYFNILRSRVDRRMPRPQREAQRKVSRSPRTDEKRTELDTVRNKGKAKQPKAETDIKTEPKEAQEPDSEDSAQKEPPEPSATVNKLAEDLDEVEI